MNWKIIAAVLVAAGVALVIWGIRTGNLKKVLGGIAGTLSGIVVLLLRKNSEQKTELKKKDDEITARKKAVEEVKDVQRKIREIDKSTEGKPEKQKAPAPGDSAGRVDRLRKL